MFVPAPLVVTSDTYSYDGYKQLMTLSLMSGCRKRFLICLIALCHGRKLI